MIVEYKSIDIEALKGVADSYSEKWHSANDAQLFELREEMGDRLYAILRQIQELTGQNYRPAREVESL